MSRKILILSLGRTGSLPTYAESITENFRNLEFDFYASQNRILKESRNFKIYEIKTYTGKLTFLFNTLFLLPYYFCRLIPRIFNSYEVLYLPYKHFWDIPFVFLFKVQNKKVVFTAHDGWLHEGERNMLTQSLNNFRLRNSNLVIFLSDFVENLVKTKIAFRQPSVVIPLPLIQNDYINYIKEQKTRNILFLGRIDQYKGVELLMDAVLSIENDFDRLIIAGKSQYEVNYIKHSKIEIRDKYLSEIEIGELLSWADLLVLPYTEASQSGVIALGIFAELPMLCTNVGGFKEQLANDECFWCDPNVNSLSEGLREGMLNSEKRLNIIEKIKMKKSKFAIKKIALQIENILLK